MTEREARLEEALKVIMNWDIPKVFDPFTGKMVSLSTLYGSNGERNYIQDIADKALNYK